jgi:ketopantoate reductase
MNDLPKVYVIGMGEVGTRLAAGLHHAGVETSSVTRDRGWAAAVEDVDGLLLVCVREESLEEVLIRVRGVDSRRMVLVQNGWIRPQLRNLPEATRGLIWFTAKGDFFEVLRPSPFMGPRAGALSRALEAGGLASSEVDTATFDRLDAEKMGFNCVVGLPLAIHGLTLGDYLSTLEHEARTVFTEAVTVCSRALNTDADEGLWGDFVRAAAPLAWVKTSKAKALDFRNGAVVSLAEQLGLEAPVNAALLQAHG